MHTQNAYRRHIFARAHTHTQINPDTNINMLCACQAVASLCAKSASLLLCSCMFWGGGRREHAAWRTKALLCMRTSPVPPRPAPLRPHLLVPAAARRRHHRAHPLAPPAHHQARHHQAAAAHPRHLARTRRRHRAHRHPARRHHLQAVRAAVQAAAPRKSIF
jgi:hypothetical protein